MSSTYYEDFENKNDEQEILVPEAIEQDEDESEAIVPEVVDSDNDEPESIDSDADESVVVESVTFEPIVNKQEADVPEAVEFEPVESVTDYTINKEQVTDEPDPVESDLVESVTDYTIDKVQVTDEPDPVESDLVESITDYTIDKVHVTDEPVPNDSNAIETITTELQSNESENDKLKTDLSETYVEAYAESPDSDAMENEKLKNTIDFDGANESLWREVIEENTLPSFEIETVHQFRSFIKVGAKILFDAGELQPDTELTDDQKAMVADLGQFIHMYGSFENWKSEKERLVKEYNEAVADLKALFKKFTDHKKRLELTLQENAILIPRLDEFEDEIKKFDDMKSRNNYLESEFKKFNALLGFSDLDITEELKKHIADTKTLDISARFLHKTWKKLKKMMPPEKVVIIELQKKLAGILNKPFDSSKMRMNLIELVKELENENADKKDRYLALFNRSQSNPLNNAELKEFVELAEYFRTLIFILKKLMKAIETAKK